MTPALAERPSPVVCEVPITLLEKRPVGEVVVSPSQIGRWDDCKRWWAWEYVVGIRVPPHPSAILGSRVHKHLEAWLQDGTVPALRPDSDELDQKAVPLALRMTTTLTHFGVLPGQGTVERRFFFRSKRGHYYTGFIDWSGIIQEIATITDHKTSSNIEKYGKTEADLHNDVQALIYALAAFAGFGVDTVDLFWNYGDTGTKMDTKPVKTRVHLQVVSAKFECVEDEVAQIVAHKRAGTHPLAFPPSPQSCGNYGGCPHRNRCNLTPLESIGGGVMNGNGQQQLTLAERMAAQTNGQPQPGYGAPPQGQPQGYPQQHQPQQQGYPQQQPQGVSYGYPPPQQPQPGSPDFAAQYPGMGVQPQQPPQQPPQGYQQPPQGYQQPQQTQQPPQGYQQAPEGYQQPQAPQQPPQEPGRAYAPQVGPNPPESGAEVPEDAKPKTKTKSAGRSKTATTLEQQIYMSAVYAALANPHYDRSIENLKLVGEAALEVFQQKFGK